MTYILFIFWASTADSILIHTTEFSNEAACLAAATSLIPKEGKPGPLFPLPGMKHTICLKK